MFDSLAQNGITWEDFKVAYDDSFKRGYEAMIDFKLPYFYAGTAIAVHERFDTTPEQFASLILLLLDITEEYPDKEAIVVAALSATGVYTRSYDQISVISSPERARMPMNARTSRVDEKAISRMKKAVSLMQTWSMSGRSATMRVGKAGLAIPRVMVRWRWH